MTPDLVVLGNLIVDDVVYADGRTRMAQAGGAALYAALGANIWGVSVGIGSVVGADYPAEMVEALAERKIDLAGLRRVSGPSMRTWLLYEGRRRQIVHRLASPTHAAMSPRPGDLPERWRPRAAHLAPMPLPVQEEWLASLRANGVALAAIDPFELVDKSSLERCRLVFNQADVLLLSEDEMLLEGALDSPAEGLRMLAAGDTRPPSRLRYLVLKRGARGGLALDADEGSERRWAAATLAPIVEGTGAGDAFAGGFLAGLVRGRRFEEALGQGIVSASFALAGAGASGLLSAGGTEPGERLAGWLTATGVT